MEIDNKIRDQIIDFLKSTEIKDDEKDIHNFAETLNINPNILELEIYKIVQTIFRGGKSFDLKYKKEDADINELKTGIVIEAEHINLKSPYAKYFQEKISLDHLAESDELKNPGYYSMLKLMEYCQGKGITVEEIKNKLDIKEDVENMKENKLKEKNYKIGDDVFFKNGNDKDIAEIIDIVDNDEYVLRSEAWVKDIQTDKKTLDLYNESTQSKKSKILKECVNMQVLQSELNRVKDLIKQLKISKVNDQELKYWLEYEWYLLQIASQEIDSVKQVRDLVSQVINDSSEVENIGPTKDASVFIRNNAFTESMKKKLGLKNVELEETELKDLNPEDIIIDKKDRGLSGVGTITKIIRDKGLYIYKGYSDTHVYLNKEDLKNYDKITVAELKKIAGYNESVINEKEEIVNKIINGKKEIMVKGKLYRWNSVYKTYNSVEGNEILTLSDLNESKIKEDQKTDIKSDIEKVMKKGENGYFILTRKQLEDISNKYKVELEDIFQYGDKLSNGDWEFQSLATVVSGIKDNIRESKIKESINSKEFFGQEDWKKDDMSILNYALKEFGYLLHKNVNYRLEEMADLFADKYPPYANDNFELIYKTMLKYRNESVMIDGLTGRSTLSMIVRK